MQRHPRHGGEGTERSKEIKVSDETQSLSDQGVDAETLQLTIEAMQERYTKNMRAPRGSTIRCACCAKDITKKTHQQSFCQTKCKDHYWNLTEPTRRDRARIINHGH